MALLRQRPPLWKPLYHSRRRGHPCVFLVPRHLGVLPPSSREKKTSMLLQHARCYCRLLCLLPPSSVPSRHYFHLR